MSFITGYGVRCTCSEKFSGDFCEYSKVKFQSRITEILPHVEYRQFDAETLAVIANLAGSVNEGTQRAVPPSSSLSLATGGHSQYVFCLTNPCENGGTCFVTNTATTKVRLQR